MFIEGIEVALHHIGEGDYTRAEFWDSYACYTKQLSQFMHEVAGSGYYDKPHATTFAKRCARQAAFGGLGWERDHKPDRFGQSIFITGYAIECKVLALLDIAGFSFDTSQSFKVPGWVMGDKTPFPGHQIMVHPDAISLDADVCIEIKSISTKGYDRWQMEGCQVSQPGYYDQAQIEMAGSGLQTCVFLYENKNTGRIGEEIVEYDHQRWVKLEWLFRDVNEHATPYHFERPYDAEPVTEWKQGKKAGEGIPGAEAKRSTNKKTGTSYISGWYIPTGEYELPWICRYCGWRETCWSRDDYKIVRGADKQGRFRHLVEKMEVSF